MTGQMINGVIEETKAATSGKTLGLKVQGKWYSTKEFQWASQQGKEIVFESNSSTIPGTNNTIWWANNIALAGVSQTSAPQSEPPPAYQPPSYQSDKPTDPEISELARALLPITSNVVAHAIAAGKIEQPGDLSKWVSAVFNATKAVISGKEFDDDIPF